MAEHADAPIELRDITKENLREIFRLTVAPEQERLVAPNAVSIAQAYFDREIAWFRAIYAGDTPVGFVMLHDEPAARKYYLWRFMIDRRYQGRGYGARALTQIIEYVRGRPGAHEILTSVVPGEGCPGAFYEKLGFAYTGEIDEGERVMRLAL